MQLQSYSEITLNEWRLNLGIKELSNEGAFELSKNTNLTNLQVLSLASNGIGNKGASDLIKNNIWAALKKLKLYYNLFGYEGIAGQANISLSNLPPLNIGRNEIDLKGATELANNKTWLKLQMFILSYNSIGTKGAIEIGKNSTWANLHWISKAMRYTMKVWWSLAIITPR
mgnify:CR=1 FL=1